MKIHPVAKAIPEMQPDEYTALKASIEQHGLIVPIETYSGAIIDGRHRYRACKELGIEPAIVEVDLGDLTPAEYVWGLNGERRHLTPSQRACVALEFMPGLKQEAKKRQEEHGGTAPGRKNTGGHKTTSVAGKSRDQAAKIVGVGASYVSKAELIKRESPLAFEEVKNGTRSMPDVIRDIKRSSIRTKLESVADMQAKEITGTYDVIVIDPPWPMQKIERDERPNQSEFDYPTMTEAELGALEIPCADNCHVWLWTTHKFLPMALRLLTVWQLKYVCTFVWHKPGGFQPVGLPQYNSEFALYARKGSPSFLDTKAFPTCFNAPRTKHSEKPEAFYDVVRRVTAGRRLDMFNRRAMSGFDVWGKEASSDMA